MSYEGRALTSRVTTSASVKGTKGTVWSILVEPSASAGSIVIKNGGASGTAMFTHTVPAAPGTIYTIDLPVGIKCTSSIYVTISNCVAVVSYT